MTQTSLVVVAPNSAADFLSNQQNPLVCLQGGAALVFTSAVEREGERGACAVAHIGAFIAKSSLSEVERKAYIFHLIKQAFEGVSAYNLLKIRMVSDNVEITNLVKKVLKENKDSFQKNASWNWDKSSQKTFEDFVDNIDILNIKNFSINQAGNICSENPSTPIHQFYAGLMKFFNLRALHYQGDNTPTYSQKDNKIANKMQ